MDIKSNILKIESFPSKSADLFYVTANEILRRLGFRFNGRYSTVSNEVLEGEPSTEHILGLISKQGFFGVRIFEISVRPVDIAIAATSTYCKNLEEFLAKKFSSYRIYSNSRLGYSLPEKFRPNVLLDSSHFIAEDFENGFITTFSGHYFFTLDSLLQAIDNPKPIKASYSFKC